MTKETNKSTIAKIVEWIIILVVVLVVFNFIIEALASLGPPLGVYGLIALSIVILILIYFRWAKLVHERKKIEWELKKPEVIDEINYAISPIIKQLEIDVSSLKRRHYNYQPISGTDGYLEKIKTFPTPSLSEYSVIPKEIPIRHLRNERIRFLRLKKFGSHIGARNKLVDTLEKALGKLADRLRPRVEKVYRSSVTVEEEKDPDIEYTIYLIIDNDEVHMVNVLKDFPKIRGEELLRLRKLPKIKEQIRVVEGIARELEPLSRKMLKDLEYLKQRYIDKVEPLSGEIKAV